MKTFSTKTFWVACIVAIPYLLVVLPQDLRAQQFSILNSDLLETNTTDAWNVSWVDINGDGLDDIFLTEYDLNTLNHVYLNDGNGDFYEGFSSGALIEKVAGSLSSSWADIDNDGDRDVHIANHTGGPNFLITNNGDGTFSDKTLDMNASAVGYYHGSSWADYDNDGYVDLFTCSFEPTKFSELYHNNGDGSFSQVLNSPISFLAGRSIGSTWVDYDNDGWQDIFIPIGNNENNALFHNKGDGTFEQVLEGEIVNDGGNSVASCWGDIDNDGDMDLFVSNTSDQHNFLYFNNGDGTFYKETEALVASDGGQTHGCNFMDVNNDGALDLYTCNTEGQANKLYLNNGSGSFSVSTDSVLNMENGYPYGQAWSDYDRDGDMDLFISTYGDEKDFLYVNEGSSNNWFSLKVKGSNSNFSGIGAAISILADGVWQMRQINSQSGFGSQNSLQQHFGVGTANMVDSVIILWSSGLSQVMTNLPVNQFVNVEEDVAGVITGVVYNDANGNCQKDENEQTLNGVRLEISPGGIYTATNSEGVYMVKVPVGTYTVECSNPDYWRSNCSRQMEVFVPQVGQTIDGIDFGKTPEAGGPDLVVEYASVAQRRGHSNLGRISFSNAGTQDDHNRTIEFTAPDGVYILEASIPWSERVGNTFFWDLEIIEAGSATSIELIDSVGLELFANDNVLFETSISTGYNELNTANDHVMVSELIVENMEPNNIQVSPKGFGQEGFVELTDTLAYRVNFQNVGLFSAQNIFIVDELPEDLDPTTIVMENMSHLGNYWVAGNKLHLSFTDVDLMNAASDEVRSQGFVTFNVAPKASVNPGTEIQNEVKIKFDLDQPLATNKTLNTIKVNSSEEHYVLEVYPNPTQSTATFSLVRNREMFNDPLMITEYRIFNLSGKVVRSEVGIEAFEIAFESYGLYSGTYIIIAMDEQGMEHHGKVVLSKSVL